MLQIVKQKMAWYAVTFIYLKPVLVVLFIKPTIMDYLKITCLLCMLTLLSCGNQTPTITKPPVFEFGSSMNQIKAQISSLSDAQNEKLDEPLQLPTATQTQAQLDISGFMYAGKKRDVELIFADDALDIIWILTEAAEESIFIEAFKALYGEPTHIKDGVTFFLNDGVAVRNNPPEVLFISDRLKAPYKMFLEGVN